MCVCHLHCFGLCVHVGAVVCFVLLIEYNTVTLRLAALIYLVSVFACCTNLLVSTICFALANLLNVAACLVCTCRCEFVQGNIK